MPTKSMIVLAVALVALPVLARAQKPSQPTTRLGVDVVSIRSGPQLFGAIIHRDANGLTMAVERTWLEKTHQRFYDEQLEIEKAEAVVAAKRLRDRIDLWIESRASDTNLVFFLQNELKRLKSAWQDARKNPTALPQFMLVDVPENKIRSAFTQPPERKQIALLAWRERLERVTTRTTSNLAKELSEGGVEPANAPINLADRLPTKPQTEKEWAAKVALVEYRMRQKVDFQGTGDYLARTGDGAKGVDMAGMMQAVLKQQMQSQLQGLLNPGTPKVDSKAWLTQATKEAEQMEVTGFRVSRLDKNMITKKVDVTSSFVARMPDQTWKVVWQHTQSRDLSAAKVDLKNQVASAPKIKEMLNLLKTSGIVGAEQQVQEALAYGAITQDALSDANEAFLNFSSQSGSKVDNPRILLP